MSFIVGQKVISASGGTISTTTGYIVHTFTSSGTFTPSQNGTVEVLVVGAGGSSILVPAPASPGPGPSGGGGGGSVIYRKFIPVGAGVSYSISIGQVIAPLSTASTITHPEGPITAPGGGSGTYTNNGFLGADGISNPVGSGGGAGGGAQGNPYNGGSGANAIGLGFSGGNSSGPNGRGSAGGGGAGGFGTSNPIDGSNNGGNGGIGVSYSINGSSVYYGAGGGGGGYTGAAGVPNNNVSLPLVSIYGRGVRGGGGSVPSPQSPLGPAGPGLVIIRYIN